MKKSQNHCTLMDMQVYISKTCSTAIKRSIDMGMQHGHSAGKCRKDM
jgi:hypothetical protein